MKNLIKAALAVAVISTPLFALEPTLETQKHDSSLMMDGMKSLNSKVEATWVSKEQTESIAKESASILKDAKTEIAPAVASAKAALDAQKGGINTTLPALPENKESRKGEKIGAAVGGAGLGALMLACLGACPWEVAKTSDYAGAAVVVAIAAGAGALIGYGVVHGVKKIGNWLFN